MFHRIYPPCSQLRLTATRRCRKTDIGLIFPNVYIGQRNTKPENMPRRMRSMHYLGDPPTIRCHSTTFLSITRQLLSSRFELARAVQANSSPLGRLLSLSGHASSQRKLTYWTKERLRSLLDQARRIRVPSNELTMKFLDVRDKLDRWSAYQEDRKRKIGRAHV